MRRFLMAVAVITCLPSAALAHHSGAMFDRSKVVVLDGTIRDFLYENPHTWIRLMVAQPQGAYMEWDIEGSGTARMAAWGMTPASVKVGDKVVIRAHPLRDGRPGASLVDIRLPNGKLLSTAADSTAQQ